MRENKMVLDNKEKTVEEHVEAAIEEYDNKHVPAYLKAVMIWCGDHKGEKDALRRNSSR